MKKSNMELVVGASIFLALFILIAGVLWLKEASLARKMGHYTVLFPNIGTLQVGDPVTVNGVKRGTAAKITLSGSKVAVVMKLDKEVVLTDSCDIRVQNIGLMGERMIGIRLSEKGTRIEPDTKGKTSHIEGAFDSGIAEAMGMLGGVLANVMTLVDTVQCIINQTVGDTAFLTTFRHVVDRLDTISFLVEDLVAENKSDLDAIVSNLHAITKDTRELLAANAPHVNSMMENGAELTDKAKAIADKADNIASTVQSMMTDIEQGKGAVGKLMQDEKLVDDLKATILGLDTLVREINESGLRLRVKLFGNRKYFRKNRQKQEGR